jgi:phage-related holin
MANEKNRYMQLIESIFLKYYYEGSMEFTFKQEDIVEMADKLGIKLPKNLGDVVAQLKT